MCSQFSDDRRPGPPDRQAVRDAAGEQHRHVLDRTPADNQTVRNVFVIGPDKKVKLILAYPMTTGRNFDEVLRVIHSMQLTAKHRVATPVNWKNGEDVIIAGSVSDDEAKTIYREGWKSPRPYIRIVPQPKGSSEARPPAERRWDCRRRAPTTGLRDLRSRGECCSSAGAAPLRRRLRAARRFRRDRRDDGGGLPSRGAQRRPGSRSTSCV